MLSFKKPILILCIIALIVLMLPDFNFYYSLDEMADGINYSIYTIDGSFLFEKDGVLVGDVDDSVRERSDLRAITPKLGGVGPLTVSVLFENVISAAQKN